MKSIEYNPDSKEIEFSGSITSYKFYQELFDEINTFYKENGTSSPPVFSFIKVNDFDSLVLPNLLAIGMTLKNFHNGKTISLKIFNTYANKFLDSSNFFCNAGQPKLISETHIDNDSKKEIVKKVGLEVFSFDERFLGFYDSSNKSITYNPNHKIQVFDNCSYDYYQNYLDEALSKEMLELKLDTIRTKKYNELKPKIEKYFYNVLHAYERSQNDVNTILSVLTEIVCNSNLYSYSPCIAILQSKDNKTKISISDIGIGLEGSFKHKPNFDYYVTNNFISIYKEKLKNYLLIFDALHYSKKKERDNLYKLLILILSKEGKMRIHYKNAQVVFTSNRCNGCEIIPLECAKCLLSKLSSDYYISPVRLYENNFQGVHIEVELNFQK